MATFLAQNQFISNACASPLNAQDTAAAVPQPPLAVAGTAVIDSCQEPVAADLSDIPEIFHWVRKLLKDDRRFVLNEQDFMASIDEEPLFLRQANG